MDKTTRKDLKTDKFAQEVTHSLEFVTSHSQQSIRYGGAVLALIVVAAGVYYYRKSTHATRQAELAEAMRIKEAAIVPVAQPDDLRKTFPTQAEKDKAVPKAFQDLIARRGGSDEASVAHYQLGILAADAGKLDEAEKQFKAAMESGGKDYSSVAKLSLAQVYQAQKRYSEAEKLLKELMDSPTVLVSKDQATFTMVRVLIPSKPAEARKMVETLMRDDRPVVARNASALFAELPVK